MQRSILARYHMTDPYNWYLQSGLWEVPNDPVGGAGSNAKETAVLPVDQVAQRRQTRSSR